MSTIRTEEKAALRRRIRQLEKAMTPEEQAGSDRALFARLNQLNCFRQAENLLLFGAPLIAVPAILAAALPQRRKRT